MGNQQSSEDASLTVSPGGTPHIQAPRSHPNTLSVHGTSATPGPQQASLPSPQLSAPPTKEERREEKASTASSASSTSSASASPSYPSASAPGPESLSDSVRGMLDPPVNASTSASASSAYPALPTPSKDVFPCAFRWVKGGREVYVTGSFNNWGGKIAMVRADEMEWNLVLDVAPGVHQYKYIVDGQWCLDEDATTALTQEGILNNVVEVKRPVFEYPNPKDADSDDDDIDERKQRVLYSQRAPSVNDYTNEPPKLPPQLTQIILEASPLPHSNMDIQLLPIPDHVTINHLYILPSHDPNLICTGITQRFKPNSHARITHKFVTTLFYCNKRFANRNSSQDATAQRTSPIAMTDS